MRKKHVFLMIMALALVIAATSVTAAFAANGYYNPAEAHICVGGTGDFYLKETTPGVNQDPLMIHADGYGEFKLMYDEPGDYHYELSGSGDVNTARYSVLVRVLVEEKDGQELLQPYISVTVLGEDRKVPVAYYPITAVNPPVKKVVEGKTDTESTFEFQFKAVKTDVALYQNNLPMPEGSDGQMKTLKLKGIGAVEIGDIVFSAPGRYEYEVTEKNTGISGYKYDGSVWRIIFDVTEGEKGYEVQKTILKDGVKMDKMEISFVNVWTTLGPGAHIKTGDESHLAVYTASMVGFTAMWIVLTVIMKKARKQED